MKKETFYYLDFNSLGWRYHKCKAIKTIRDNDGTQYYNIEYLDELNQLHKLKKIPSRDLLPSSRTAWEYCCHFNDLGGFKRWTE